MVALLVSNRLISTYGTVACPAGPALLVPTRLMGAGLPVHDCESV